MTVPQDIPVEASETLAFTPDTLKDIPGAPSFTLRAVTSREKRFRVRLHRENGILSHTQEAIQEETLNGLKAMWTDKEFQTYSPWLTDYWSAQEDFVLLKKDDPDLEWEYDPQVEAKVSELITHVERNWPPLARMMADAAEYQEYQPVFYIAVTVADWTGLDVDPVTDRNYLTLECAEELREALVNFEIKHKTKHNLRPGIAWLELYAACLNRHHLVEEEEKNSESPSPSRTSQARSTAKPGRRAGKSQASATSQKTPSGA